MRRISDLVPPTRRTPVQAIIPCRPRKQQADQAAFVLYSLDDEQQATLLSLLSQTLKYRLPEIQDQAQHAASASGSNIVNSDFRDGMDGEERERESELYRNERTRRRDIDALARFRCPS